MTRCFCPTVSSWSRSQLLQCCVRVVAVCLSFVRTESIVANCSVLEQKLLLTAYRKAYNEESIGTKM